MKIRVFQQAEFDAVPQGADSSPGKALQQSQPDAHLVAGDPTAPLVRCSAWWRVVPLMQGQRLGVIGHYMAADGGAPQAVLQQALSLLRESGCTYAVGPMDGNTWRRYRFVIERGERPPFLMEPWNPPEYPAHFEAVGFAPIATYRSTLVADLARADPRLHAARERLQAGGVRIRSLDLDDFEADLRRIHAVSSEAFQPAFLYTPLSVEALLRQYLPLRQMLDPRLVLIAELGDEPVGFSFNVPDGGPGGRTLIVKTLAARPGRGFAGLGNVLLEDAQHAAHALGYRSAIHALTREGNPAANISDRAGVVMRRYALYGRPL